MNSNDDIIAIKAITTYRDSDYISECKNIFTTTI